MGDGLVGAMVEALRRANRRYPKAPRPARQDVAREGSSAWAYLTHPGLMPTVFCPASDDEVADTSVEIVAERKV